MMICMAGLQVFIVRFFFQVCGAFLVTPDLRCGGRGGRMYTDTIGREQGKVMFERLPRQMGVGPSRTWAVSKRRLERCVHIMIRLGHIIMQTEITQHTLYIFHAFVVFTNLQGFAAALSSIFSYFIVSPAFDTIDFIQVLSQQVQRTIDLLPQLQSLSHDAVRDPDCRKSMASLTKARALV